MIYSLWDPALRAYRYFETSEPEDSHARPAHLRPDRLGLAPEQAGWPLPPGARPVGSGALAKGRLAGLAGMPTPVPWTALAAVAALAWLALKG